MLQKVLKHKFTVVRVLPQNAQYPYSTSKDISLLTWFRKCLCPCKRISMQLYKLECICTHAQRNKKYPSAPSGSAKLWK